MEEKLSPVEVAGPGRCLLTASDVGYTLTPPSTCMETGAQVPACPRLEDTKSTSGCAKAVAVTSSGIMGCPELEKAMEPTLAWENNPEWHQT